LPRGAINETIAAQAVALGVITQSAADRLSLAQAAKGKVVEVDVFTPDQYYRD